MKVVDYQCLGCTKPVVRTVMLSSIHPKNVLPTKSMSLHASSVFCSRSHKTQFRRFPTAWCHQDAPCKACNASANWDVGSSSPRLSAARRCSAVQIQANLMKTNSLWLINLPFVHTLERCMIPVMACLLASFLKVKIALQSRWQFAACSIADEKYQAAHGHWE